MMYDKEINPNGHEIIQGVTVDNMSDRLKKLLSINKYEIMNDEKLHRQFLILLFVNILN